MVEVSYQIEDLFSHDPIQVLLEARDTDKELVGEASVGKAVDPSTGLATVEPGQTIKVAIRMNDDYEGSFELMALDPDTNKCLSKLKLKTDYTI